MVSKALQSMGKVGDYEIRLLRVFKTVVECGGFSAAEVELNISRSTISVHMSNLEARLKLKLCQRGRSGFSLTEEGLTIYNATRQLFSRLAEFRSTVNALHQQMTGEVRILTSDTISLDERCGMDEVLAEFAALAPDVYISFDTAPLGEIERRVINGDADVGFIPHHRDLEGLNFLLMYKDKSLLYCGDRHPLFNEQDEQLINDTLKECKLVHAGVQTSPESILQLAEMNKAAEAYYYETRATMILSGVYVGFMAEKFAQQWVDRGRMRALLPETRSYNLQVAAISRRSGPLNKPRDLFMELLTQHIEATDKEQE
ncbi:LysR family transcriptional regulator [Amphritea sp.]|uniref:LysR family transcriptional regulator n=1 Tax=Amphritea sp. TaxID=1872502 RepID=UPI0025BBDC77|nr:LysR family transcriptional regulator [Amphritea sp.]